MSSSAEKRPGAPGLREIVLIALAAAAAGWLLHHLAGRMVTVTPAAVRSYIQSFGPWSAAVFVAAYILNHITILPPIAVMSLAAGLAFGEVWGAVYLFIGAVAGTSLAFFLSRSFGRKFSERALQGKFKDFDARLGEKGFETVFFLRLVPLVPYEVINYGSGLSKIRPRDYFWATFWGLIPGIIVNALLGGGIGDMQHWKDAMSPKFLLALIVGAASIGVPLAWLALKQKKTGQKSPF